MWVCRFRCGFRAGAQDMAVAAMETEEVQSELQALAELMDLKQQVCTFVWVLVFGVGVFGWVSLSFSQLGGSESPCGVRVRVHGDDLKDTWRPSITLCVCVCGGGG